MKKSILLAASGLTLLFSSCYMDPYNSGVSYGASSTYGYGSGHSSSVFVSTGNPQWSYDPYRYSYYDNYRRSYYDPYLHGYYPSGYVPVAVHGCPHPYGWSGGRNISPPSSINTRQLSRYDQRVSNYAAADYHWSRKVGAVSDDSSRSSSGRSAMPEGMPVLHGSSGLMRPSPSRSSGFGGLMASPAPSSRSSSSSSSRTYVREAAPAPVTTHTGGMLGSLNRSRAETTEVEPPVRTIERSAPSSIRNVADEEDSGSSMGSGLRSSGSTGGGLRGFQR